MAADIRAALIAHMEAFPTDWPIAWENEPLAPSVAGYLDVQLFLSTTQRQYVELGGGTHVTLGFLQVAVMAPLNASAVPATEMADAIAAHFPADLRLGPVRITQKPHVAGGIRDGGFYRLPITIEFQSTLD